MLRTRTFWAMTCGCLAALSVLLAGCGQLAPDKKAAGAVEEKKQERLYPVNVQMAEICALKYEVNALGTVEAQDVYQIHALVPGTLYGVNFSEGDKVGKDDTLCTIAPDAYRFTAMKAEGIYKNAAATVDDMKRKMINEIDRTRVKLQEAGLEIARRKEVREAGGISTEEIQLYESKRDLAKIDLKDMGEASATELKVLEATVLEKDASWKIALDDVRKSVVKPPISGVIEKRAVTSGMFVQPGMLIATIVDRSVLKLRFKVAEKDSALVKPGMKIQFTVPAWPGREFEAEVYFVANQLDMDTRSVDCFARIVKQADALKPNYFASVRMTIGSSDHAIVIPGTAILPTEKGFVAFVEKNGKAQQRFIKTGLTVSDGKVEVLSGIVKDERVVIEGANALLDGSPLKVLNDQPSAPVEIRTANAVDKAPAKQLTDASPEKHPEVESKGERR